MTSPTQQEAQKIINPLRSGTVPSQGLQHYAVGLDREISVLRDELKEVKNGMSHIKGIRAPYGGGKTFITSRLAEDALEAGFVISQVTLNREAAPLHQLEKVFNRIMTGLQVRGVEGGALSYLLDRWLDKAEEYAIDVRGVSEDDEPVLWEAVRERVRDLLGEFAKERPAFAGALNAYYEAHIDRDYGQKQQIIGWLSADSNVSAQGIRGIRGRVERKDVVAYLRAFIGMVRHLGYSGLVIILDEVDDMRKLKRNHRETAWSNLRDIIDQIGSGIPGFYLVLAGTPEVFDSNAGFRQLIPLYQRFEDPTIETERPNLRGPQLPLPRFDKKQLTEVMQKLKTIWEIAYDTPSRIDDDFAPYLAEGWTKQLGDKSPRIAIREFISILDRARDYPEYDPYAEYHFNLGEAELNDEEMPGSVLTDDNTF